MTTEPLPTEGQAETLRAVSDDETRPCEVCNQPVPSDDRWEILRATGPIWRHPWHTEQV